MPSPFVRETAEVQKIVRICGKYQTPVIAYGTGTSLEGHFSAPFGGISVDLSQMNRILAVNADDLDARVEAGVTRKALNVYLRDKGLFFPIDPGADASLGGMAATRAPNAVRYGTMRENVLNVTAVMANGEVSAPARGLRNPRPTTISTRLEGRFEGTLGITEVGLRLYGIPESIAAGFARSPASRCCCQATIQAIQMGLPVARIELVDEEHVKAFNAYSKIDLKVAPTLFLEFHGSTASTAEQAESFAAIAGELGGGPFVSAVREEERQKLWQARHDAFWATKALMPGKRPSPPMSACRSPARRMRHRDPEGLAQNGLYGPIAGHVGDGTPCGAVCNSRPGRSRPRQDCL
jgi:D-lactate dehydrogenase (cytochrome)